MVSFPSQIAIKTIDAPHPLHKQCYDQWERARKLYEGGRVMRDAAKEFLVQRPTEMPDVYEDRIKRFTYINHEGNIVGWYLSALFKEPPTVILRDPDTDVEAADGVKETVAEFQQDVDLAGTPLIDFWRRSVEPSVLLYQSAYILIDVPVQGTFASRAQQKAMGGLRPILRCYTPQDILNWYEDEQGNLEWAVLKLLATEQEDPFQPAKVYDRWYVFTRSQVAAYQREHKKDEVRVGDNPPDGNATLMEGFPREHSLSDQNIVPLFKQDIDTSIWIGNRVESPLVKLLNLENSHDYSLEMTNLAQLAVFAEKPIDKIQTGGGYYLQFGKDDRCEFIEQSGKSFIASQSRIIELREEVYRLSYLVAQGRSASAAASSQSGYSKEQDMLPARDVLAALGDRARMGIQTVLQAAITRMGLDLKADVQGMNFADREDVIELEVIERATSIVEINSPEYQREIANRIVEITLPDLNRDKMEAIKKEIAANPTELELAQQQQAMSQKLTAASKGISPRLFEDAAAAA
jgi:hypothetical protein